MDSWDWHCGHTREKKRPRPIHKKFHSGFHYHAIHSGLGEHDPTIQVLNIPANQDNPEPPHTDIKPDVEAAFGFAYCCQFIRKIYIKATTVKSNTLISSLRSVDTPASHHLIHLQHIDPGSNLLALCPKITILCSSICQPSIPCLPCSLVYPRSWQPHSTIQVSHSGFPTPSPSAFIKTLLISIHYPLLLNPALCFGCQLVFLAYSWPTRVNTLLGEI